jgi:holo-[acyl-carrier protein] synthase
VIYGTGVDLVTVTRIEKVYERFGERFARRFLHEQELSELKEHPHPVRFLAKRFAVKEASVKALGTGERSGVLLKDFYILHTELGKPILHADGEAKQRCDQHGIRAMHVSLSDEGDQVVAFVVLETG